MQGRSLVPLLTQHGAGLAVVVPRRVLQRHGVSAHPQHGLLGRADRRGTSTSSTASCKGMDELYDLEADPYELTNLIARPEAARDAAADAGGAAARCSTRRSRGANGMNNFRFAFRQLRKSPAFTVTALATVAICLKSTTFAPPSDTLTEGSICLSSLVCWRSSSSVSPCPFRLTGLRLPGRPRRSQSGPPNARPRKRPRAP